MVVLLNESSEPELKFSDKRMGRGKAKNVEGGLQGVEKAAEGLEAVDFVVASEPLSKRSLETLRELYDLTKHAENDSTVSSCLEQLLPIGDGKKGRKGFSKTEIPLSTLITEGFGEDQIWEEIQLQNALVYDALVSSISKVLAYKPRLKKEVKDEDSEDETILKDLHQDGDGEDSDSDFFESDEAYRKKQRKSKTEQTRQYGKSVVDDKFFNLAQMTEFVEEMEKDVEEKEQEDEEDESGDEKIDYFKDDEEEEDESEEHDYYYKDFFDPPLEKGDGGGNDSRQQVEDEEEGAGSTDEAGPSKTVRFNLEEEEDVDDEEEVRVSLENNQDQDDDESSEDDQQPLSNFERRKKKIEENIKALEEEALKTKPWQLTGEVTAETRPENSLLEEHLMYDHLLRQAPEITVKTTHKLEDIIKQRVKDQAWDDVIRKIKPIENVAEYKKRLVLDAEKSKMSLAEIYEKEYVEKHQPAETVEEDRDPEEHKTIQADMRALFAKLDALSHFNYTPKAPVPEVKTIRNAAATSAEEITPSTYSDAMLLAPQEILEPAKGEVKGKGERSSTDKKRERRLKKKKQHLKRLAQEEKARAKGLGLRNIKLAENVVKSSKKNADNESVENSKELKSSKAFFTKLQEHVTNHIDKVAKRKQTEAKSKALTAKKFKM